jgi:hypothetical protein
MSDITTLLTESLVQVQALNDLLVTVHPGLTEAERRGLAKARGGFFDRSASILSEAERQPELVAFVGVDTASLIENRARMEAARPLVMALTVLLRRVEDVNLEATSALWQSCLDLYAGAQTTGRRNQRYAVILRELEPLFQNNGRSKAEVVEAKDEEVAR